MCGFSASLSSGFELLSSGLLDEESSGLLEDESSGLLDEESSAFLASALIALSRSSTFFDVALSAFTFFAVSRAVLRFVQLSAV